jgi:glycine oxidase
LLSESEQQRLEPCLSPRANAMFLEEQSVDPRALVAACLKAARHHGVDIATGEEAKAVTQYQNLLLVETPRARYGAGKVVNCCGAWAGAVEPVKLPVRPVKGQMFSVVTSAKNTLRHVVHGEDVYIVPRSNGRMLIGATIEEAGFDKRVEPQTIQRLHQAAADLVPSLGEARMLEAWAGLRPASADDLPVLGATPLENYFIATAHFRNGILLAPITARLMAQIIAGKQPESNLAAFSPNRFLH